MTIPYLADVTVESASQRSQRNRQSALRNPRRRWGQWTLLTALVAAGYLLRQSVTRGGR